MLLTALAVTVLSVIAVLDLRVDATFMGILDPDDQRAAQLAELTTQFGAASGLMLVIRGGDEEERQAGAEEAANALAVVDEVVWAEARIDEAVIERYGLVFLDDEGFDGLNSGVRRGAPVLAALGQDPSLVAGLTSLNDALADQFSARGAPDDAAEGIQGLTALVELIGESARRPLTVDDIEGLVEPPQSTGAMGLPVRDGWLASSDGEVYVVDVRTTLDPLHVDIGMDGFASIEGALDPVRAAHPSLWMNFSGLLPGGYQDQQNVLSKVLPLSSLSLVLVLLALAGLDRRPTTPLLVGAGLLMALVWTFALVRLVFGYASLTSTAFGVLLFGLGVDYAVHIIVRFNDERADGVEGEQAMVNALERTGRGVVVGAATSMTAFALMTLTDFQAATQLGVTAAMGLGCALVVMIVVLPASLALVDRWLVPRRTRLDLPILDSVVRGCLARPKTVLAAAVLTLVAVLTQLPRFELETDLEKLITQDIPAMEANHIVAEAFGGSVEAVLSVSDDLETSRARAAKFEGLSSVARVDGIHTLLPPDIEGRLERNRRLLPYLVDVPQPTSDVDVQALLVQLERLRAAASRVMGEATFAARPDIAREARSLKAACEKTARRLPGSEVALGAGQVFLMTELGEGVARLDAAAGLWSFSVDDLPQQLTGRYVADGQYLLYVYPTDYRIAWDFLKRFKAEVLSVDPSVTGTLLVVDQLLVGGVDRLPFALGMVLLSLVVILWFDLRRIRLVAVALVPLVLGSGVAVGAIIAMNIPISILMLSAVPVVFGIGIDDGVHILHRWEEGERDGEDVARAVAATGKAILFTSVTTALGFSILFLLNHRGLAGMAMLVLLGVGTCFITSITLLPVLARYGVRR